MTRPHAAPATALAPAPRRCHRAVHRALAAARADLERAHRHVARLEGLRTRLGMFVPRAARRLLEQGPGGASLEKRETDVSVLFLDIVASTRLREQVPPAEASALVERYFAAFLDEVLVHGGDVNELAGDGLMVIFDDRDPYRHACAAVWGALGVLRRTRELNEQLGATSGPIALHAGINSGPVTLGVTRIEGRADARWTYTASGLTTNLAARLAELGTGDGVIVGPVTRDRLGTTFACEPLGEVALRSLDRTLPAWRVKLPVA